MIRKDLYTSICDKIQIECINYSPIQFRGPSPNGK